MDICSRYHDEIVHDNGYNNCPLCEKIKEIERLESEINDLKDEYENKLENLQNKIDEL